MSSPTVWSGSALPYFILTRLGAFGFTWRDPQCGANYCDQVRHLPVLVRRGVASLPFPHPLLLLLQSVPPRPLIGPFTFSMVLWEHLLPFAPLFCTLTAPSAVAQSHFWPGMAGVLPPLGNLPFKSSLKQARDCGNPVHLVVEGFGSCIFIPHQFT